MLKAERPDQAIIFARTKIGVDRLARALNDDGLRVKALHGDMSQGSRDGVMIAFKGGRERLLVATDVAARGLDITGVTHVINYDIPNSPDIYVHRIGRTGRVGRAGRAITLITPQAAARPRGDRAPRRRRRSGQWSDQRRAPAGAAPSATSKAEPQRGAGDPPPRHTKPRRPRRTPRPEADRVGRPRAGARARRRGRRDRRQLAPRGRGRAQRARARALQLRRGARRARAARWSTRCPASESGARTLRLEVAKR